MPDLKILFLTVGRFIKYLPESMALLVKTMEIDLLRSIRKNADDRRAGISYDRPTIVESFFESEPNAPVERIVDESFAIAGAGTETTSWALTVATFHLLTKPEILARLTEELREVVSDSRKLPSWTMLEKLPYLSAVIQESLRLSCKYASRRFRGLFSRYPLLYVLHAFATYRMQNAYLK